MTQPKSTLLILHPKKQQLQGYAIITLLGGLWITLCTINFALYTAREELWLGLIYIAMGLLWIPLVVLSVRTIVRTSRCTVVATRHGFMAEECATRVVDGRKVKAQSMDFDWLEVASVDQWQYLITLRNGETYTLCPCQPIRTSIARFSPKSRYQPFSDDDWALLAERFEQYRSGLQQ